MSGDSLRRVLRRCVEDYGYSWDTTRQIINRMLGGHYTVESLQALYRKDKELVIGRTTPVIKMTPGTQCARIGLNASFVCNAICCRQVRHF